jgi:hypothetical protein
MPISRRKQDRAYQCCREIHAHTFEIEHADGDEVAGMHAVVKAEGEPLDLLVTGNAKLIAHVVADAFAIIVLHHGEDTAQHACAEQQQCRGQQRILRRETGHAALDHRLGVIDGASEKARDHQLKRGRDKRCANC